MFSIKQNINITGNYICNNNNNNVNAYIKPTRRDIKIF